MLLNVIILGIIQGLTEFLPVSSSGHLVIAQHYFEAFPKAQSLLFDVMLHLGTLFAIFIYYRNDIWEIVKTSTEKRSNVLGPGKQRFLPLIIIASIPTAFIGIVFEDIFHVLFTNILCTSLMLIVTGGIILFASFKRSNHKTDNAITIKDALLIGTAQGIAIIPGISRSGATIATGIFLGIDGETAARFSFLTSIPAILGAVGMECFKIRFVPSSEILYYILGMVMAAAVGTVAIGFLVNVLRRLRLGIFAYYCFFVGGIFGFFNL